MREKATDIDLRKEIRECINERLREVEYKGARRNEIVKYVCEKIYGENLKTTDERFVKVGKIVDSILSKMERYNEVFSKKEKNKNGRVIKSIYWLPKYAPFNLFLKKSIEKLRKEISENVNEYGEAWLEGKIKDKLSFIPSPKEIRYLAELYSHNNLQKKDIDRIHSKSILSKLGMDSSYLENDILFIIAALFHPNEILRKKAWQMIGQF